MELPDFDPELGGLRSVFSGHDGWETVPSTLSCSGLRHPKTRTSGRTVGKSAQSLRRAVHRITRRELLLLLAGATTAPRALHSQQNAMQLIGFLDVTRDDTGFMDPFRQGLRETGYIDGNNVAMEYRVAQFQYDRLPALAADLVSRKVDVIVAIGNSSALAAKSATSTIPIVFITGVDPVKEGLVASVPRPRGNITGVSFLFSDLHPKRLELLAELLPYARMTALFVNPNLSFGEAVTRDAQDAARAKEMKLQILKAGTEDEIDAAFETLAQLHVDALLVGSDPFFESRHQQLVALASRYALPTIYPRRSFADAGGLISYGPNVTAVEHQLGIYAGKILKGAKPADLPVQQPPPALN